MEAYNQSWQRNDARITISKDFYEHLLNCLCNQKYVQELKVEDQIENQKVIDKAWRKGYFIFNIENTQNVEYKKLLDKLLEFCDINKEFIDKCYEEDKRIFIANFKYSHVLTQELIMWIKLCTYSNCLIDADNQIYNVGVIDKADYDEILLCRGYSDNMKKITYFG